MLLGLSREAQSLGVMEMVLVTSLVFYAVSHRQARGSQVGSITRKHSSRQILLKTLVGVCCPID